MTSGGDVEASALDVFELYSGKGLRSGLWVRGGVYVVAKAMARISEKKGRKCANFYSNWRSIA